jgi:hypothetical protein
VNPSPWGLDHADHRLPTGMHVDVLFKFSRRPSKVCSSIMARR